MTDVKSVSVITGVFNYCITHIRTAPVLNITYASINIFFCHIDHPFDNLTLKISQ